MIDVTFESVHVSGPEPSELRQPGIELLERFRLEAIETALCVHRGFHETSFPQNAQVFRYGRLRHSKLAFDLSDGALRRDQEAQNRSQVRLRNDLEYRFHSLFIPS